MSDLRRLRTGRSLGAVVVAVVAMLALTACSTKFTGGGQLPTEAGSPSGKATFGFTFQVVEDNGLFGSAKMKGAYHDGDVRLKFRDAPFAWTLDGLVNECMNAKVAYESQNPAYPGDGYAKVKACDFGEPGASEGDRLRITVLSGPYAGYSNGGEIIGGNLQTHS